MRIIYLAGTFLFISLASCKKDWLDAKPSQSIVDISKVKDLQALLDNTGLFNQNQINLLDLGTDEYYIPSDKLPSQSAYNRNIYLWTSTSNFYDGAFTLYEWNNPYYSLFCTNLTIEKIDKIPLTDENKNEWNSVKGSALFYRAFTHFRLSQVYAKPYTKESASSDLGIILRTEANINTPSSRASIEQTYDQIEKDLKASLLYLPSTQQYKTRPTKNASLALLAKFYLVKGDYDSSLNYANLSQQENKGLINLDSINKGTASSFKRFNTEVIFHSESASSLLAASSAGTGYIDTTLYSSYDLTDNRKNIFFNQQSNGRRYFTGSYSGNFRYFSGLSTNEIYLIKAECHARLGQVTEGIDALNILLFHRYSKDNFQPYSLTDKDEALKLILRERWKELCFRSCRWGDLRRLNQSADHKITLRRIVDGVETTLLPNDPKYVYPIPDSEIRISNVSQNPR